MEGDGFPAKGDRLFDGIVADVGDDECKTTFVGCLEVKITQGVDGGAVIGVFNGDAGSAYGVAFAVFDGPGDGGLGVEPAGEEE